MGAGSVSAIRHRRRRVSDTVVAIDLGTSRTQVLITSIGIDVEEPNVGGLVVTVTAPPAWVGS